MLVNLPNTPIVQGQKCRPLSLQTEMGTWQEQGVRRKGKLAALHNSVLKIRGF